VQRLGGIAPSGCRAELRKHMRKVKRSDPSAACFIQYDKLYVNNKIFVFNDLQGKVAYKHPSRQSAPLQVVEQQAAEDPLAMSLASLMLSRWPGPAPDSRPGSVLEDRPGSALSGLGLAR
jgi:hypothetical protein